MRWIRKLVVVGLAAFGAYRIYELARTRAQIAAPPVSDAVDTIKATAGKVKDDLSDAHTDLVDELRPAIAPESAVSTRTEPPVAVPDGQADPAQRLG